MLFIHVITCHFHPIFVPPCPIQSALLYDHAYMVMHSSIHLYPYAETLKCYESYTERRMHASNPSLLICPHPAPTHTEQHFLST